MDDRKNKIGFIGHETPELGFVPANSEGQGSANCEDVDRIVEESRVGNSEVKAMYNDILAERERVSRVYGRMDHALHGIREIAAMIREDPDDFIGEEDYWRMASKFPREYSKEEVVRLVEFAVALARIDGRHIKPSN